MIIYLFTRLMKYWTRRSSVGLTASVLWPPDTFNLH